MMRRRMCGLWDGLHTGCFVGDNLERTGLLEVCGR